MGAPDNSDKYQLFQRAGTENWQVRFSVKGHGQIKRSLNTSDRDEAERKAYELWYDAQHRAKHGLDVKERSFRDVAEQYIEHLTKCVERGDKTKYVINLDAPTIRRYFIEYFGDKPIDAIGLKDITKYTEWRKVYWMTGPGAKIESITYKRAGRIVRRPVYNRKTASPSRLRREAVMLRQIFTFAFKQGYVSANHVPLIETVKADDNPRASFTKAEFDKLHMLALRRATEDGINRNTMHERRMQFAYINLMAYSGMRVSDAKTMIWGDVRNYEPPKDGEIRPPTEITLSVRGKKHPRIFIPHTHARISIDFLYKAWEEWMGRPPEHNDPLFFNRDGSRLKSFSKGLNALLKQAGLERDHRGQKRAAGSFRHYYIEQMVVNNISAKIIADNTGTTTDMIDRFYANVEIHKHADELRAPWKKST